MKFPTVIGLLGVIGFFGGTVEEALAQNANKLTSVPIQSVTINDSFWSPKREVWQKVTIPDCFDKFENDRDGALNNFDRVRDGKTGGHAGPPWCAMPGYIYAQDQTGVYVNLFVGSKAKVEIGGKAVRLELTTGYPWSGGVKIKIEPGAPAEFDLGVRIPGWCSGKSEAEDLYQVSGRGMTGARMKVNGEAVDNLKMEHGYATLHRSWKSGDVVELNLDMPVERVTANGNVAADKGRVALTRGPIVYCFEGADNGSAVENLAIPPNAVFAPEFRSNLLGGVTVLTGLATGVFRTGDGPGAPEPFAVTATPYFANANRGTCPMQVWMEQDPKEAKPQRQD